jgi:hypothetical protein
MISARVIDFLMKRFRQEPKLHPIDAQIAKRYIKRRLCLMFPELREDPQRLEAAYRALSLEPREGTEEGDAGVFFEVRMPRM